MIKVTEIKKQKLTLKKENKNLLKVDSHIPSLRHLTIVKLTPLQSQKQNPSFLKPQSQKKIELKRSITPMPLRQTSKSINSRSQAINIRKSIKNLEYSKTAKMTKIKQQQQQILADIQCDFNDKIRIQNCQSAQNNINKSQSESIQQQINKNIKLIPFTNQRRNTCPLPNSIQKCSYPNFFNFSICNVINLSIFREKYQKQKLAKNHLQPSSQKLQICSDDTSFSNEKLDYLSELISQKEQILSKKLKQIKEAQTKIDNLKNLAIIYEQLNQKCHVFRQQMMKMEYQMQNYLEKQPSKILKQEVLGYKQREQELFDLANSLQYSQYQSMLRGLYNQIEVPQGSLFYTIQSFEIDSTDQNRQDLLKTFKEKVASIYNTIMNKIKMILKLKGEKIKLFVKILRELASYTIGKRQYLTQINKKVINLCPFSILTEKPKCQQTDQIIRLKKIIQALKQAYTEAQIFY